MPTLEELGDILDLRRHQLLPWCVCSRCSHHHSSVGRTPSGFKLPTTALAYARNSTASVLTHGCAPRCCEIVMILVRVGPEYGLRRGRINPPRTGNVRLRAS